MFYDYNSLSAKNTECFNNLCYSKSSFIVGKQQQQNNLI